MKGPGYPVTIRGGGTECPDAGKQLGGGNYMEPSYDLLVPSEVTVIYSQQCPGIRPHLFRDRGRRMSHVVIDEAGRVAEISTGPPAYYYIVGRKGHGNSPSRPVMY